MSRRHCFNVVFLDPGSYSLPSLGEGNDRCSSTLAEHTIGFFSEQLEEWGRWIEAVLLSPTTWEWANHQLKVGMRHSGKGTLSACRVP